MASSPTHSTQPGIVDRSRNGVPRVTVATAAQRNVLLPVFSRAWNSVTPAPIGNGPCNGRARERSQRFTGVKFARLRGDDSLGAPIAGLAGFRWLRSPSWHHAFHDVQPRSGAVAGDRLPFQ